MSAAMPQRLFKYMGITPQAIQLLCKGSIHYSDPAKFNDPLDCRPKVQADLNTDELKDLLSALIALRISKEVTSKLKPLRFKPETISSRQQLFAQEEFSSFLRETKYFATHPEVINPEEYIRDQLTEAIEEEVRRAYDQGILCLSSKVDSPLMWSHYAQQHSGVCLELDVSALPPGDVRKVNYGESRELAASAIRRWIDNPADDAPVERACLLTKASDWNYEDEYRLLGPQGERHSSAPFRSITFGLKCEPALRHTLIAALGGADSVLKFHQITHSGSHFHLGRRELDAEDEMRGWPSINMLQEFERLPPE